MFNTNVGLFENMKPVSSKVFDDVLVFHTEIFRDFRGTYVESFNQAEFERYSDVKFVQDDFSSSKEMYSEGYMEIMRLGNWSHAFKVKSCFSSQTCGMIHQLF